MTNKKITLDLLTHRYLREILAHPDVTLMNDVIMHGDVSVYQHCMRTVRFCLRAALLFGNPLRFDLKALAVGAFLHDFFLYDWHKKKLRELHGFVHPRIAMENASARFPLTKKERDIIFCHMWPFTFWRLPRNREGWLLCLADKCCSVTETMSKLA